MIKTTNIQIASVDSNKYHSFKWLKAIKTCSIKHFVSVYTGLKYKFPEVYEPRLGKTCCLHMQKHRHRSAER